MSDSSARLRHSFGWTLAGNVVYAGCQWAVLVTLTRLFPMEEVGRYSLAVALSAPLLLFAGFKLRSVVSTDLRGEYLFADYFALRLAAAGAALVLTPGLVMALGFGGRMALLSLVVAVAKALDLIADLFHGLLQRHEQYDQISLNLILNGVLTVAAMGAVVVLTGSLLGGLIASAVISLVALIDALRRVLPIGRGEPGGLWPRWQAPRLALLTRMTAPLGAGVMLSSFSLHFPRYVVGRFVGMREVAVLAALSYIAVVGGLVVNALGQAATPRLAQLHAQGDEKAFSRLLVKLLGVGAGLGAIGVVAALTVGGPVLELLYGPEYAVHTDLFVIIVLATAVTYAYLFVGTALSAMRVFSVQLPINLTAFCVLVVASFGLVQSYGVRGVAIAMVLAALTEGGLLVRALYRRQARDLAMEPA